jgi:hypothetical protein
VLLTHHQRTRDGAATCQRLLDGADQPDRCGTSRERVRRGRKRPKDIDRDHDSGYAVEFPARDVTRVIARP